MSSTGHLFVIQGDVTKLGCDGWFLPTDASFEISDHFLAAADLPSGSRVSDRSWNGRRVIPYRNDGSVPRIWLGQVGSTPGEDPRWYAGAGEEFVRRAAEELRRPDGHRPPMVALPVIGTGEGGGVETQGEIHEVMLPTLAQAARTYGVDVTLVCRGRPAYAAAQRMRRRLVDGGSGAFPGDWGLGENAARLSALATRLARESTVGRLVLFLGAGVSAGAGLPDWQELMDRVAAKVTDRTVPLDSLHHLDLRDQARLLRRWLGGSFDTEVSKAVEKSHYGLTHGLLASLRAGEAVTTNYDTLYESAVEAARNTPDDEQGDAGIAVLPYQPVRAGEPWLLKLHGSIGSWDGMVASREDYLEAPMRRGALFGLVQALLMTRHMLFVGYSLRVEHFHQLVHEVRQALGEDLTPSLGTVVTLFEDPLLPELWKDEFAVEPLCGPPASADGRPSERELAEADRRLQLLLDLVALRSADVTAHLLDDRFSGVLDEEEATIAEALRAIQALVGDAAGANASPAAARVGAMLRDLGLR